MISELDRERASEEATAWLIRLREEPDDRALRQQFEAWRDACPAHGVAWAEVEQAFSLIGEALSTDSVQAPAPAPITRRHAVLRRLLPAAAVVALAACLALVFLPGLMLRIEADHATATGEWREVRLADGSVVDLAPRSAITVALDGDRRAVRLVAGQAFFQVTPDAARPFHVDANGVRTTVIGTAFDVRLARQSIDVSVRHGVVRVDDTLASSAASRILEAGDWVRVSRAGRMVAGREDAAEIGAWRRGQLVAHDRPIAEVVDELRPYFGGMIVIANDSVARRRVTGVYALRDPVEALRAVGRAHDDISVTRVLPWLLVVSGS